MCSLAPLPQPSGRRAEWVHDLYLQTRESYLAFKGDRSKTCYEMSKQFKLFLCILRINMFTVCSEMSRKVYRRLWHFLLSSLRMFFTTAVNWFVTIGL